MVARLTLLVSLGSFLGRPRLRFLGVDISPQTCASRTSRQEYTCLHCLQVMGDVSDSSKLGVVGALVRWVGDISLFCRLLGLTGTGVTSQFSSPDLTLAVARFVISLFTLLPSVVVIGSISSVR